MKSAIDIRNVSVSLKGREILKNISISVEEGNFMGIVGPNGGGKTTLIKLVLGLVMPTSGSVSVFGAPPETLLTGKGVFGYLPQHQNIDPNFPATALDIVLMGRYRKTGFFRWPGEKDKKKAMEYMSMLAIDGLINTQYSQLSGGQQQRVSIARALAGEPKILILDEPSTGIDVVGQEDFYHLLKGFQKKMGLTILMVSHDIGAVTTYVDEISCLNINLYYHGNPLGALNDKVMSSLYGKNFDLLMHADACEKCERLRR